MMNFLIAGTIVALAAPWIFIAILLRSHRRSENLWRESLVYLKAASSYEAQDAIDRIKAREKTLLEKGLAKMNKQGENPPEEEINSDMAADIRGDLEKRYGTDIGTGK